MKLTPSRLALYVEASEHLDWLKRQQQSGRLVGLNEENSVLTIVRAIEAVDAIAPVYGFFRAGHKERLVRACIVYEWFEKQ